MSELEEYFENLKGRVDLVYRVATLARAKGFDPVDEVECPLALNMAERAVSLVKTVYSKLNVLKISSRILELEDLYGKLDMTVSFVIAREIAEERFGKFDSLLEAIDCGIRVGFAYMTLGVVASPIEGYTGLRLGKTKDGKEYFVVSFSGPIRSAGTTSVCLVLMLIDYLREYFGFAKYDPSEIEVKRYVQENKDYHERVSNLAYFPTEEEMVFLAERLPIQLDGDPTERLEVSNFKDLKRVGTNQIRGGMCLAFSEGLAQKASKALGRLKGVKGNGVVCSGWDWLEDYVVLHKKRESGVKNIEATYIKDIVAGRPVYGHPGRSGGFRFRYGRGRTSGFSGVSVHPATMGVTGGFLSHGTQLRLEKPTKACVITSCDSIDGPIVLLKSGSVRKLDDYNEALKLYRLGEIEEIIYLGDILFPVGDVIDRNFDLIRPGYVEEWWAAELEDRGRKIGDRIPDKIMESSTRVLSRGSFNEVIGENDISTNADTLIGLGSTQNHGVFDPAFRVEDIGFEKAVDLSREFGVSLHPSFIFYWSQISNEEFVGLMRWLNGAIWRSGKLVLNWDKGKREEFGFGKRALEILGVSHEVVLDNVVVDEDARALLFNLGKKDLYNGEVLNFRVDEVDKRGVLEIVNDLCELEIKDKAGTFIGARMGRPEKAKLRKLIGSPNSLFPVGDSGGRLSSIQDAVGKEFVRGDFPIYRCRCGQEGIFRKCEICGGNCKRLGFCRECGELKDGICKLHGEVGNSQVRKVDIKKYFEKVVKDLGFENFEVPALVKGVKKLNSESKIVESLAKGILRARQGLSVNKDGTIRYDAIEIPLTHFRPREIGVSVEKILEFGYLKDIDGCDLVRDDQILELMPQDIVLPDCLVLGEERADKVFLKIAKFVDEELERFYGLERFYDFKDRDDLIGAEVVCMAPHNCAGVIGRIIGFSNIQGLLASPFMHAAVRRDCDGDEMSVMLLMDVLLNFSREFLPSHRGGRQDAPLVLNARIRAGEVDDQILFFESCGKYPLSLYEAAERGEHSSVVRKDVRLIGDVLRDGGDGFVGNGFSHDSSDFNLGNNNGVYKSLPTMKEKVAAQMALVGKLRGVDEDDVARLVLERHFIRDIRGNLRKFAKQGFRCSSCGLSFRRPPLVGVCTKCSGKLIFTVSEGSIRKYLEPAMELVRDYKISSYTRESMELIQDYIERIFGIGDRQVTL